MRAIIDFIDARLPGFAGAIKGSATEFIEELQTRTSKPLPRLYVEFLRMMGDDSSVFPVFPGHVWSTAALIDCWPGDECVAYDKSRYFKISLNAGGSSALSHEDYFLDLARSDGEDAPIVSFEDPSEDGIPGEELANEVGAAIEWGSYLRDWLAFEAFHFFELMRRKELASCGVSTDIDAPNKTLESVHYVLSMLKLQEVLRGPQSFYMVGEKSCVEAFTSKTILVRVGADSKKELVKTIEFMRDHLEILEVNKIPRQESPTSL